MPTTINNKLLTDITGKRIAQALELKNNKVAALSIKTITSNDTYIAANDNVDGYSEVTVNVPNSYVAEDEGKVVSNNTLITQTSATKTANGTYDTTTNNEIVVNVAPNLQSKTATENGTVTADSGYDGLSSVTVNVSGGGGPALFYCAGEYLGDIGGTSTTSLSATLSADVGTVAVIVVMHRSALTIPNGWTLVDHRDNPMTEATGNVPQQISILKRTMAAAQESVTITQSSSNVRMCGSVFYFSADPNITYDSTQALDSGLSTWSYTIPTKAKPTFIVISNVYTYTNAVSTMVPEGIYAKPNSNIRYFNTDGSSTESGFRLLTVINNAPKDIVITQNLTYDENSSSLNRAFIYTLG